MPAGVGVAAAERSRGAADLHWRSLAKAISWRAPGSIGTFAFTWMLTGRPEVSDGHRRDRGDDQDRPLLLARTRLGLDFLGQAADAALRARAVSPRPFPAPSRSGRGDPVCARLGAAIRLRRNGETGAGPAGFRRHGSLAARWPRQGMPPALPRLGHRGGQLTTWRRFCNGHVHSGEPARLVGSCAQRSYAAGGPRCAAVISSGSWPQCRFPH